jgi:hypothetical protein
VRLPNLLGENGGKKTGYLKADDGHALNKVNDAPIREFNSGMLSGFHFFFQIRSQRAASSKATKNDRKNVAAINNEFGHMYY